MSRRVKSWKKQNIKKNFKNYKRKDCSKNRIESSDFELPLTNPNKLTKLETKFKRNKSNKQDKPTLKYKTHANKNPNKRKRKSKA